MRSPLDQLIYDATRGLGDAPPGTKLIRLTKGFFAVVDEVDFERVSAFRWHVLVKKNGKLYAQTSLSAARNGGKRCAHMMHRFILGVGQEMEVDHRDGNGLHNGRLNLRPCTHTENARNRRAYGASSVFKGVAPKNTTFQASIYKDGRKFYLGAFPSEVEAARAYDDAARRLFGPFARLNFADDVPACHAQQLGMEISVCLGRNEATQ